MTDLLTIDAITQFVNGTQEAWNSTTIPVPSGLVVYAPDTTVVKIGDGSTLYENLPSLGTLTELLSGGGGGSRPGYSLAEWPQGAMVQNGLVYFVYRAPSSGTINSLDYFTGNGSFVVAIKINDIPVGGLGAVSVNSSTPANIVANTGSNSFNENDSLVAIISSTIGNPTNALLNINLTWS